MTKEATYDKALLDYFKGKDDIDLLLHTSYGTVEEMPVEVFFRGLEDFTQLEKIALESCKGKILDIGAGAGSFTVELEDRGLDVTALDISPACCHIMQQYGIKNIKQKDIWTYSDEKYDTLLLIMNGIGLAGTLEKLPNLLLKLKDLLNKEGQIIFDSSDISYLYTDIKKPEKQYYGEIKYRYEYLGIKGEWFNWLYIDEVMLKKVCDKLNLKLTILYRDENDQYLGKISV